tara:strand:- start:2286 stop:2924 length:639 start_codon:yes stop_codon:yes gene_type:complete
MARENDPLLDYLRNDPGDDNIHGTRDDTVRSGRPRGTPKKAITTNDSRFTKQQLELLSRIPDVKPKLPESWKSTLFGVGTFSDERIKREIASIGERYEEARDGHFAPGPARKIASGLSAVDDVIGNTDEALSVARAIATKNPWVLGADIAMKGTKKLAAHEDRNARQTAAQYMSNLQEAKRQLQEEWNSRLDTQSLTDPMAKEFVRDTRRNQ